MAVRFLKPFSVLHDLLLFHLPTPAHMGAEQSFSPSLPRCILLDAGKKIPGENTTRAVPVPSHPVLSLCLFPQATLMSSF